MNWQSLLAGVALLVIAAIAAGSALRLAEALGAARVTATVLLLAVLVLAVVAVTVQSLARSSTPYW